MKLIQQAKSALFFDCFINYENRIIEFISQVNLDSSVVRNCVMGNCKDVGSMF